MIEYPVELLEAFDPTTRQGVVVFVGSGPSCDAGLPSWRDLLHRIAAEVSLDQKVAPYLNNGQFLMAAQFLANKRSERDIQDRVVKQIKRASKTPGPIHELIVSLPLAGIITTNYDLLLTKADKSQYFNTPRTHKQTSLRSQLREHFLLHLHGHVDDPETIVLTRQSYDDIVFSGSPVKLFLSSVFQSHVVLFIGFGFADSHIDEILGEFKQGDVIGEASVFALIPSKAGTSPDEVQEENLRFRFINPIYVSDHGDHGTREVGQWLEGLRDAVDQITRSHSRSVRLLRPAYVVEELRRLFVSDQWHPLLTDSLSALPNRPDLKNLVRAGLSKGEVDGLFTRLGLGEMRIILMSMNRLRRDPILEDTLSCFPPVEEAQE